MSMNPFNSPASQLTDAQKISQTVARIKAIVLQSGQALLASYTNVQTLVNKNPYGLSAKDVNAALGADADMLQTLAIITKTCINTAYPDTIKDTVPVAKVTMPK